MALADAPETESAQAPARDLDGYAYPYADKKGTYLVVMPPEGNGKGVEYEAVEKELKRLNLEALDLERVKRAVSEASGKAVRITGGADDAEETAAAEKEEEAKTEKEIDKSQFVFLTFPEDHSWAKLTLVPPEDKAIQLNAEDIDKVIEEAGIKYGLNEEKVAEAKEVAERINAGELTDPVEFDIAHGIEPKHGHDAEYELFFDLEKLGGKGQHFEEAADGRVDYFAVQEIENTKRGARIALRKPPTKGVAGRSIRDQEIPARDGAESQITIGRGIEHALGNENILVAAIDGQVKFVNNILEVLALYEIQGDVDLSTGSIDFIGSVMVHGNVQPGLKIIAGEDVTVEGVVDDAEIHAGGKVNVKGGILGQGGKSKIVAAGDVNAKYVRNAAIECKGVLTANEGILHSHIAAYAVKVMGKRGQIVGGEISAETEVHANTLGSNVMATPTQINVGESIARRNEMNTLTEQIKKMEEDLDKAKKGVAVLKVQQERAGSLPAEKKQMLASFTRMQFKLMNDLKPLQDRMQALLQEEEEVLRTRQAKVAVLGTLYPGVTVKIRNARKQFHEELRYCTLTEKGSEIKQGPYR